MAHLRLLGGAILTDAAGAAAGIASRRLPLALLATAPSRTLSRAKLVALLWPESPERTARNRLSTTVHRVRRALGEGVLVSVGEDLRLDAAAIACDVCAFEEALATGDHRGAVELYGGPFLDGFHLNGSFEFEEWLGRERQRLRHGYEAALEDLAGEAERAGDVGGAVHWWRLRAAEDPYDTRVAHRLVGALAAAGNRAEALRVAESHTGLLEEELGAVPDLDLQEAAARPALPDRLPADDAAAAARASAVARPAPAIEPRRSRRAVTVVLVVLALAAAVVAAMRGAGLAGAADASGGAGASAAAARELYEQAEQLQRNTPASVERNEQVMRLHRRALELDSTLAPAWVGLAGTFLGRAWLGDGQAIWADSARVAAHRALALDSELASAYARLGDSYWPGGPLEPQLAAYERALELDPDQRIATNNRIVLLGLRGRIADALRAAMEAYDRSPDPPIRAWEVAFFNSMLGHDSVADHWLDQARARGRPGLEAEFRIELLHRGRPEHARRVFGLMPADRRPADRARESGALALYEHDWAEARRHYRALFSVRGGTAAPVYIGVLHDHVGFAWALDRLGGHDEAREIAAGIAAHAERDISYGDRSSLPRERLAIATLILGDTAGALQWLEDAVDAGYRDLRMAMTLPMLDPLRGHPRFHAWLDRLEELLAAERRRIEG